MTGCNPVCDNHTGFCSHSSADEVFFFCVCVYVCAYFQRCLYQLCVTRKRDNQTCFPDHFKHGESRKNLPPAWIFSWGPFTLDLLILFVILLLIYSYTLCCHSAYFPQPLLLTYLLSLLLLFFKSSYIFFSMFSCYHDFPIAIIGVCLVFLLNIFYNNYLLRAWALHSFCRAAIYLDIYLWVVGRAVAVE